jgi:hypothetical protein
MMTMYGHFSSPFPFPFPFPFASASFSFFCCMFVFHFGNFINVYNILEFVSQFGTKKGELGLEARH